MTYFVIFFYNLQIIIIIIDDDDDDYDDETLVFGRGTDLGLECSATRGCHSKPWRGVEHVTTGSTPRHAHMSWCPWARHLTPNLPPGTQTAARCSTWVFHVWWVKCRAFTFIWAKELHLSSTLTNKTKSSWESHLPFSEALKQIWKRSAQFRWNTCSSTYWQTPPPSGRCS